MSVPITSQEWGFLRMMLTTVNYTPASLEIDKNVLLEKVKTNQNMAYKRELLNATGHR